MLIPRQPGKDRLNVCGQMVFLDDLLRARIPSVRHVKGDRFVTPLIGGMEKGNQGMAFFLAETVGDQT